MKYIWYKILIKYRIVIINTDIHEVEMIDNKHPGGLFTLGIYGCEKLTDEDKRILEIIRPSGVILFQRNIRNARQISDLIAETGKFLGFEPLFSIDQEGGIVTRLTDGFSLSPGAMALGRTGDSTNAYEAGRILGKEMKALGIDWDLAPVVDINNNPDNPGIGVRSFGPTRETVTEYAGAFVRGLGDSGIISCLKHFPGKGRVTVDAHLDMPELDIDESLLFEEELYPYIHIDAPSWMPSHVYYPALQSERIPASVSREVLTGLVRGRLGYRGVLISDDMTMGGIANYYSVSEGVKRSFYAGMDNLLICHDFEKQMESYRAIAGEVAESEEAALRMKESLQRMERLFRIRTKARPSMDCIASVEHLKTFEDITGRSVAVMKNLDGAVPMNNPDLILSVKLSRKVQVEDTKNPLPLAAEEFSRRTDVPVQYLDDGILDDPDEILAKGKGKRVVLFTENAHLSSPMTEFATTLSRIAGTLVLCALRNPYDCDIDGVRNSICSFGYTPVQQMKMVDLLSGEY